MLLKKQIIHIIYNELTASGKLGSSNVNSMLCAISFSSFKSFNFTFYYKANSGLKRIFCCFETKKEEEKENCLRSFTSYKGFQGGFCLCLHCSIELIQRARSLVLLASQFRPSINKDLFNN